MAEKKTNAMRILDTHGIAYSIHTYDVSDNVLDGVSVAQKTNQYPEQVFKTLVTQADTKEYFVFVIPVAEKLDLKAAARSAGVKSIEMIPQKNLLPLTGYVQGGCSPAGMKKQFKTFFDETIVLFDTILVSGGKLGMQVEVKPDDLLSITQGTISQLTVWDKLTIH